MTDQPEKRHEPDARHETEDVEADFEGHKLSGPEKVADITDAKAASDDDGADFEGHKMAGPDAKAAKA